MDNNNNLGCFLKGLGAVFAGLLVLLLPVVLFGFNAAYQLTDGEIYKEGLSDHGGYQILYEAIAAENLIEKQTDPLYTDQFAEAYRVFVTKTRGGGWLQIELEKFIDDLFAYLNGETNEMHSFLSTEGMLDFVESAEGQESIRIFLQALPQCSAEDYENEFAKQTGRDFHLPYCGPSEAQLDEAVDMIQLRYADSIEYRGILTRLDEVPGPSAREILRVYQVIREVLLFSPLALVGTLMLIVVLSVRSLDELLKWTSIPIGLGSGGTFLLAALGYFYTQNGLLQAVIEIFQDDVTMSLAVLLGNGIAGVAGLYLLRVILEAGVLLLIALLGFVIALILGRMTEGFE